MNKCGTKLVRERGAGSGEQGLREPGAGSRDLEKKTRLCYFWHYFKGVPKKILYFVNFSIHYRGIRSDL
jgi:hypothetical protein